MFAFAQEQTDTGTIEIVLSRVAVANERGARSCCSTTISRGDYDLCNIREIQLDVEEGVVAQTNAEI